MTGDKHQVSIFTWNRKFPRPSDFIPWMLMFLRLRVWASLGGGQLFRFLLCASPVVVRGHTQVLLATPSALDYLSQGLLLEEKKGNDDSWSLSDTTFHVTFSPTVRVTSDPQCKLLCFHSASPKNPALLQLCQLMAV